jgi:hypothetical protein
MTCLLIRLKPSVRALVTRSASITQLRAPITQLGHRPSSRAHQIGSGFHHLFQLARMCRHGQHHKAGMPDIAATALHSRSTRVSISVS